MKDVQDEISAVIFYLPSEMNNFVFRAPLGSLMFTSLQFQITQFNIKTHQI